MLSTQHFAIQNIIKLAQDDKTPDAKQLIIQVSSTAP